MIVFVSSRTRLMAVYWKAGFEKIDEYLHRYAKTLSEKGIRNRFVYLEDVETGYNQHVVTHLEDWGSVVETIRSIVREAEQEGDGITHVCILGGHRIIPFCTVRNPVNSRKIDPDGVVYTDNPYGIKHMPQLRKREAFEYMCQPSIPVSRIPDGNTRWASTFIRILEHAINHHVNPIKKTGACVISNLDWLPATREVISAMATANVDLRTNPSYRVTSLNKQDLSRRFLYTNLHGFINERTWRGFDRERDRFTTVMGPGDIHEADIRGATIFCENCYGGYIINKKARTSCAMRAMHEGALTFIGATGLAFGSHIHSRIVPIEYADRLASEFFQFYRGGKSAATALRDAREHIVNSTESLNTYALKTLLQFTVYGDPTL